MSSTARVPETIEFDTQIGDDGIIRVPAGMTSPSGQVRVHLKSVAAGDEPVLSWLLRLVAEAESDDADLPVDLALNHDHYLYGTPQKDKGSSC